MITEKELFELFESCKGKLLSVAAKIVKDKDMAEDIVQDSITKAWDKLYQFKGNSSLYTWLYRIVVNTSLLYLAKMKRRPPYSSVKLAPSVIDPNSDEKDESWETNVSMGGSEPITSYLELPCLPEDNLYALQLYPKLMLALEKVRKEDKVIFLEHYHNDQSYLETAKVLGVSLPIVRAALFKVRKRLKEELSL